MKNLKDLWKRGCDFLGVEHALMGGAMSWISEHQLVSALSNAGGFGVLACGSMDAPLLRAEIQKTKKATDKPFGVNLITMSPYLPDLIQVCVDEKVSHVVLAGGLPSPASIKTLKEAGIKVLCFAPALALAKKLIKSGADALIIEGMEAGGHIGPVSTSVLAQEILPHVSDIPVFVAGGIGRGEAIVSYLEMGAAGCQIGTRLVCTEECIAHPAFKSAFLRANARDAVPTVQLDPRFPVIPVRAIYNKGSEAFIEFQKETIEKVDKGLVDLKTAQLDIEYFWAGSLRRAVIEGDVENGSLMAGQSVGMVKSIQTVNEVVGELLQQANDYILSKK